MKRKSSDDEPVAKRTRLQSKLVMPTKLMMTRLMDLPLGPLHQIFSKLDPTTRCLVGNFSDEMKAELVEFTLHEYKSFLHIQRCSNNASYKNLVNIVDDIVKFYVSAGFVQNFIHALHYLLEYRFEQVTVAEMISFLYDFYGRLRMDSTPTERTRNTAKDMQFHRLRLLDVVSLLNMLRKFTEFHVVKSEMNLMHWQLHIEIWGIYISGPSSIPYFDDDDELTDLKVLLAKLLIQDMSEKPISDKFTIDNKTYYFGLRIRPLTRSTRLSLKFTILANPAVRNLLETVIAGNIETSMVADCDPMGVYSIALNVKSSGGQVPSGEWNFFILPLY
ncbi:hypothetical protein KR044_003985 [Drosophila immigrans]|nr:hypothetical protein KR044_003985 [Drosophila immigrans]